MITCSRALGFTLPLFVATAMGCSTFERDWEAHRTSEPVEAMAPDPAGLWEGTWLSGYNGHTGTLRCILEHVENESFSARYKATYAGWLTFEYTMSMTVRHKDNGDNGIVFAGEADLGSLAGGVYTYDGHVQGDEFRSTYKSSADHGTFEMKLTAKIGSKQTTETPNE